MNNIITERIYRPINKAQSQYMANRLPTVPVRPFPRMYHYECMLVTSD